MHALNYDRFWVILLAVIVFGCSSETKTDEANDAGVVEMDQGGIDPIAQDGGISPDATISQAQCEETWEIVDSITVSCGSDSMTFDPLLLIDGQWQSPTTCDSMESDVLSCTFDSAGTLVLRRRNQTLIPTFEVSRSLALGGFRLKGQGQIEGVENWLSNGYQSWSQSGQISLSDPVDEETVLAALRIQGDLELVRTGQHFSWWTSYVYAPTSFVVGATTAKQFKTWVQVSQSDEGIQCILTSGGLGAVINASADDIIEGDRVFLHFGNDLTAALRHYGEQLPHREVRTAHAEAGWNSWYELWDQITEVDIMENAALVPLFLDPVTEASARPYRIVVDDGWQKAWGDWTANPGFPNGMAGTATQLSEAGFLPGIWMAPLLVEAENPIATENPDWFLDGAEYVHPVHGSMRILDVTVEGAANHLKSSVAHLVNSGFSLLKIDFLFSGTFNAPRSTGITPMASYDLAMQYIREAAGPETILLGVGAPPIAGFAHLDAWRIGPDVAVPQFDASWYFVQGTARSTAARWFFCAYHLCDGDPALLRGLERNEVETASWIAALAGGAFFLSDDLRLIEDERRSWLTSEMVALGIAGEAAHPFDGSLPEIPFQLQSQLGAQVTSIAGHQLPLKWRLPSGETLMVNVSDESIDIEGETIEARGHILLD